MCLCTFAFNSRKSYRILYSYGTHRIRHCRNAVAPNGRPPMLYHLPHLLGASDHLKQVSQQAVEACREECLQRGPYPCDETVFTLSCLLVTENSLHPPTTPDEAIELYLFLRFCLLLIFVFVQLHTLFLCSIQSF